MATSEKNMEKNENSSKTSNEDENINLPNDVLLQVESLFRSIDNLSSNAKEELLSKIRSRLESKEDDDTGIPLKLSDPAGSLENDQSQGNQVEEHSAAKLDQNKLTVNTKKLKKRAQHFASTDVKNPSERKIKDCFVRLTRLNFCSNVESAPKKTRKVRGQRNAVLSVKSEKVEPETFENEDGSSDCNYDTTDLETFTDPLDEEWEIDNPQIKKKRKRAKTVKDNLPVHCPICKKFLTQKSALGTHMRRHNGIKPYECSLCDYRAVTKIDIIRHIPIHTGKKNYTCEFCGKSFANDNAMKSHIKHVHVRTHREICHICGFITHSREIMRRHNIVKHTEQEKIECPVCHEIIKQKGTFQIHMRRHTGLRPHECATCQKCFRSSSQLSAHMRSHQDGKFPCEECGHLFKTKSHLQRHSVVHTGAKPFACHLCEYRCNVKGNITKHVRLVHHVSDFTLRESQPKATEDGDREALQKGVEVAERCLKEASKSIGMDLTLEDLKLKDEIDKQKVQENNVVKKPSKRNSKPKCDQSLTECRVEVETVHEPIPLCSDIPEEETLMAVQQCASENNTVAQQDILSDAMQLLTSGSANGNANFELESLVQVSSHTDDVSDSSCSTMEMPVTIDGNEGQPMNMYIIRVITNPTTNMF